VLEEAGVRVHGTTREQPLACFDLERPLLRALPAIAPDLGTWSAVRVHRDCHVQFERCYYSVPFALIGQALWLRATDTAVAIYQDSRQVAMHVRGRKPGQRFTVPDHLPPRRKPSSPAIAPGASPRPPGSARPAPNSSSGCSPIGSSSGCAPRKPAATGRALRQRAPGGGLPARLAHDSLFYRTVKTILAGGFDQQPLLALDTSAPYAGGARFVRDAETLFGVLPPSSVH
jgi:hypothetical protein